MSDSFASVADREEKPVSFQEIGRGCYAFTAQGDPNTGVIIGDDGVIVIDAQATPAMAQKVVEKIREVTDKPVRRVVLTHYHAVRTLGASAYDAGEIIASDLTRRLIAERGQQDFESELARFPRLFQGAGTIPGLTWPTMTFSSAMSIWLGKREVRIMTLGRGHTMGDIVCFVPDEGVMYSGDLVEYRSACYCGDAHLTDWPKTLERLRVYRPSALMPGRGDALTSTSRVEDAFDMTGDFLKTLFDTTRAEVAKGASLKDCFDAVREVMDPKFSSFAIYEHCLPFNVARAFDEANGIDHPRIWTASRDRETWEALQSSADVAEEELDQEEAESEALD